MDSANVELVRSILAAWERGDYGSAEWAHPDIEFVVADGHSPGRWVGRAGMAAANRDWLSAWNNVRQELDECRELVNERVLVLHRFSASGKLSGLHTEQIGGEGGALFEVRNGKVVRLVHYFDRERAFAALGVAPEPRLPGLVARSQGCGCPP